MRKINNIWVCVVCVWFLLYLFFYLCCERCVVCVWFCIHNYLFVLFLLFVRIQYIDLAWCSWYMLDPAHMLSSFRIYTTLILIPAYVYPNIHTHFPPLPYSYTFIAIFICIVSVMFCIYTYVFVYFLLFPNLNRHLRHGVYWYNHTPTYILTLWFLLYFHFVILTSTIVRSLCLP